MNLKELKELIELVSEKDFAEFEIERQGFRLRITRFSEVSAVAASVPAAPLLVPAPLTIPAESPQASAPNPADAASAEPDTEADLAIIKAPLVGTFYSAPSPSAEPFVRVGDHVETETVVCIIEAMKLMNPVQAEVTGTVARIFVENGQAVEYGQPLFGIKV